MFDDPTLVADAGLLLPATLMVHLGLEGLINDTVRLIEPAWDPRRLLILGTRMEHDVIR